MTSPDDFFPRGLDWYSYARRPDDTAETAWPPFEPYRDDFGRSHEMVEALRSAVNNWDAAWPHGGERFGDHVEFVANLYLLADLANAVAEHVAGVLGEAAAERVRWLTDRTRRAVGELEDVAKDLAA